MTNVKASNVHIEVVFDAQHALPIAVSKLEELLACWKVDKESSFVVTGSARQDNYASIKQFFAQPDIARADAVIDFYVLFNFHMSINDSARGIVLQIDSPEGIVIVSASSSQLVGEEKFVRDFCLFADAVCSWLGSRRLLVDREWMIHSRRNFEEVAKSCPERIIQVGHHRVDHLIEEHVRKWLTE